MSTWIPPTQAEVERYFERLNNWGRWGKDDERGTLNLITSAKRAAAVQLARSGRVVSLARDITPQPALDYHMLYPLQRGSSRAAIDYVGMIYHGYAVTHIDALCHVDYRGQLYNGRPFDTSIRHGGATWGALDAWFDGVVTRGVLLDVASLREEGYVTVGKPVTPLDLDAAATRAGVTIEPGDAVVVRSGREAYEAATAADATAAVSPQGIPAAAQRPGLHIACLEWLREHDVAALAWDLMDERPVGYEGFQFGVHLAIPLLGLCLIDNTYPERLVAACQEEGRYTFLFTVMPLRLAGSTGSPCHPVAIF
ncbi:MAG: cyclase [Candidatus Tectimicrobiota bacterium]|nr:MAG: cyclase [Candidatus Tectomicrobia bacterium]